MATRIAFAFLAALVLGTAALATQASATPRYKTGWWKNSHYSYFDRASAVSDNGR